MKFSKYSNELTTKYIIASRIVCSENAENADLLLCDTPRQAALADTNLCILRHGGYVLLDFGEELCGGIDITVHNVDGGDGTVRISFGESVMEALSSVGDKNSTNDHSVRDSLLRISAFSNFRVGQTGFRFVRIESVDCSVRIGGIKAVFEYRDIEYKGSFESNDELLNRIWHIGARTVHLNMQNYLWDGIKRDRLIWIGDMHAEVSAISCVFGYNDIVDKSLDFIKDITPPDRWMNGIPSYSLWWLIIRYEWYMHTGDKKYIQKDKEYILALTEFVLNSVADNGCDYFANVPDSDINIRYFVDWETCDTPESKNGFYSLLIIALKACHRLCNILGDFDTGLLCEKKINVIQSRCFINPFNRQIASLMALAGLRDAKEVNKNILMKEPVCDVSAFLGYYTLLAKGMACDIGGALDIIRGYWGRMTELGATTFWESFDYLSSFDAVGIDRIVPEGKKDIHGDGGKFCYEGFRCSLCHGWACGPTPFMSRYVLGVEPLEAGCKKVSVKPKLDGIKSVYGTYPTPFGNIEITAENKGGKVVSDIKVPDGVELV